MLRSTRCLKGEPCPPYRKMEQSEPMRKVCIAITLTLAALSLLWFEAVKAGLARHERVRRRVVT